METAFNDPITEAYHLLEGQIYTKIKSLKEYAKRPNANEFYIQKENQEIEKFVNVLKKMKPLQKQEIWRGIENSVIDAYKKDETLCGFQILVIEKPFNGRFSNLILDSNIYDD